MRHVSRRTTLVLLTVVTTVLLGCHASEHRASFPATANHDPSRETILDRRVHLEPEIHREIPPVPRWCSLLDLDKRHIHVGDCELYCELEGAGPPLVLLHGGPGATHHYFHPAFSQAADFAQVIYYDQRGCGVSEYQPGLDGYSIRQAVDDLDHLRAALNIDRWVVLGHSYGGLLAQCYAATYPEHLAGLVLVCSSLPGGADTGRGRSWDYVSKEEIARIRECHNRDDLTLAQQVYNAHLNGDWKRQSYYRPSPDAFARTALYEWKHDPRFRSAISSQTVWIALADAFATCPVPTLIVESTHDLTWGDKKPQAMHAIHPRAQMLLLDASAHSPFEDQPDRFFPALRAFMQQLLQPSTIELAAWQQHVGDWWARIESSAGALILKHGWGQSGSEAIAQRYTPQWLSELTDPSHALRVGFALYDTQRYAEALDAFRHLAQMTSDPPWPAIALIWQGHMLDLLNRRPEALTVYQQVVDMDTRDPMQHGQYRLKITPSPYAAQRLTTPFKRVENRD